MPPAAPPREGVDAPTRHADEWRQDRAARAVADAVRPWLARLEPLQGVAPGAEHVRALRDAWRACERLPHEDDPHASRTRRTRAALDLLLDQLERALATHDATPVPARDSCILVRRWIEERTFALPRDDEGVHLVDADAAPYGLFDHARIVGLLEGEWPAPSAREIFYPAFMLQRLGWPEERTRTAALRARFADLLTLPAIAVGVSVPELDQDAVVRPSSLLDELEVFGADALIADPVGRARARSDPRGCPAGDAGRAVGDRPRRRGAGLGGVAALASRRGVMRGRRRQHPASVTASRPSRRICSAPSSTLPGACSG